MVMTFDMAMMAMFFHRSKPNKRLGASRTGKAEQELRKNVERGRVN